MIWHAQQQASLDPSPTEGTNQGGSAGCKEAGLQSPRQALAAAATPRQGGDTPIGAK